MDLLVPFVAKMPQPNGKSLGKKMNSIWTLTYVIVIKSYSDSDSCSWHSWIELWYPSVFLELFDLLHLSFIQVTVAINNFIRRFLHTINIIFCPIFLKCGWKHWLTDGLIDWVSLKASFISSYPTLPYFFLSHPLFWPLSHSFIIFPFSLSYFLSFLTLLFSFLSHSLIFFYF